MNSLIHLKILKMTTGTPLLLIPSEIIVACQAAYSRVFKSQSRLFVNIFGVRVSGESSWKDFKN
jgi:hypothetical protein